VVSALPHREWNATGEVLAVGGGSVSLPHFFGQQHSEVLIGTRGRAAGDGREFREGRAREDAQEGWR
jgi:hypothetical protein